MAATVVKRGQSLLMPFYRLFGLAWESNLSLPVLLPVSSVQRVDFRVVWVNSDSSKMPSGFPFLWYTSKYQNEDGVPLLQSWRLGSSEFLRYRFSDGVEFVLNDNATCVWGTWPETSSLNVASIYLTGAILGLIARRHGCLGLHASAVKINGYAIAFLGPPGAGKSTLAAMFASKGFSLLTDDIVVLKEQGDSYYVQPGYPQLKLWPQAVRALGGPNVELAALPFPSAKGFIDLTNTPFQFSEQAVPLGGIYVLGPRSDSQDLKVEFLSLHESFKLLLANLYTQIHSDKRLQRDDFERLSTMVRHVPVRLVRTPVDLSHLDILYKIITSDFSNLTDEAVAF